MQEQSLRIMLTHSSYLTHLIAREPRRKSAFDARPIRSTIGNIMFERISRATLSPPRLAYRENPEATNSPLHRQHNLATKSNARHLDLNGQTARPAPFIRPHSVLCTF
jgi:hypothetical protein